MARGISRHPQTDVDLIEIADYIAQDNVAASDRFLTAAEACFRQLAETPELGSENEFDSPFLCGIRRWRIKGFENFLVFYRAVSDGIEVIRVLHGSRDIDQFVRETPVTAQSQS